MVQRWDIITIGNISRNRYWGERDDMAYRPALCTCTLVTADTFRLLVDPSVQDGEKMAYELFRRSGLKPEQIDVVFVTHAHGDHHAGLKHFPAAQWLAAASVAGAINKTGQYAKEVEPAGNRIREQIDVIPTPGHTRDHHALRLDCEGQSVVIAGDAVMTRDFFRDRRGYFNSADLASAAQTIDRLAKIADIVVPGHDNYFLNPRTA